MAQLPFPQFISLKRWAAELLCTYRTERLPVLIDEENWQEWANGIAGAALFRSNGVPSATNNKYSKKNNNFKDWQEWAKAVYIIMMKVKPVK